MKSCTNELRTSCTNELHERVARKRCMKQRISCKGKIKKQKFKEKKVFKEKKIVEKKGL